MGPMLKEDGRGSRLLVVNRALVFLARMAILEYEMCGAESK